MSLIAKIKSIFTRKKESETEVEVEEVEVREDIEELVEKAKKVKMEESDEVDPWRDFKAICKEIGVDHIEVISKAAWYYLEETGGVVEDPLLRAKEVVNVLKEYEEAVSRLSEPKSVKKLRMYNEALKEVAEFKAKLQEVKSGKLTAKDLIPLLKMLMGGQQ